MSIYYGSSTKPYEFIKLPGVIPDLPAIYILEASKGSGFLPKVGKVNSLKNEMGIISQKSSRYENENFSMIVKIFGNIRDCYSAYADLSASCLESI